jgi:hypothetical protein
MRGRASLLAAFALAASLASVAGGRTKAAPSAPRSLAAFDTSAAAGEWLERWQGTFPSLDWGDFAREGKERAEPEGRSGAKLASDWERVSTIRWSPSRARALSWCGCREEVKEILLARPADSTSVTLRSYGGGDDAFDGFWPSDSVAVLTHLRTGRKAGASRLVVEVFDLARNASRTWVGPETRPPRAR